jgi:hypothetical protein
MADARRRSQATGWSVEVAEGPAAVEGAVQLPEAGGECGLGGRVSPSPGRGQTHSAVRGYGIHKIRTKLTGSLNGHVRPGASSPTQTSVIAHSAGITKNHGPGTPSRRATAGPTTAIVKGNAHAAYNSGVRSGKHARSLVQGESSTGTNLMIAKAMSTPAAVLATAMARPRSVAPTTLRGVRRAPRTPGSPSRPSCMPQYSSTTSMNPSSRKRHRPDQASASSHSALRATSSQRSRVAQ